MNKRNFYPLITLAVTSLLGAGTVSAQQLTKRVVKNQATQPTIRMAQQSAQGPSIRRVTNPLSYGDSVTVLYEDFSKMPQGSIGNPDTSVELTSDSISKYPVWINLKPEYTHQPGWGGHYIYPAGGVVSTSAGDGGNLDTPMLDCSGNQGVVFLEFKARTDDNAQPQSLIVEGAETHNMSPTWDFLGTGVASDITAEWKTYTFTYYGAGPYTMFNIVRQQMTPDDVIDRVYIDDVRVYTIKPHIQMPTACPYTDYKGNSFVAHWTKVKDATRDKVNVYTKTQSYDGSTTSKTYFKQDLEVTDTMATISGITSGETYYYTVRAVNANGQESFECPEYEVFDLEAPVLQKATIKDSTYKAAWNEVPSAERYNYWAYFLRTATTDGEFTLTNEPLSGLQMTDGSDITWTIDNPTYYTYDNYIIQPASQAGWDAKNGIPYPDCLAVDGWQYIFNHTDAGLVSPEFDLSKDGGKLTVKMQLRGDKGDVWYNDGSKETRFTRCAVALFNWDEQLGDYKQAELHYTDSISPEKFNDYTIQLTKGSARSKIGIYAVWAPANLFIKNLVVTQKYKAGESFVDPFVFGRWLETTSDSVVVPRKAYGCPISHKVSAVKTNPQTMKIKESLFSDIEVIGTVDAIQSVGLQKASVLVENGRLLVNGNGPVSVYTLDGKLVYSGRTDRGALALPLQRGSYVVKTADNSVKVVF